MLKLPRERGQGIKYNARSFLKPMRMGKKWNRLGLSKSKGGVGGGMDQMKEQRVMLLGPKDGIF